MARREAGEGSIYKRIINSQVYWTAQVYTHKDPITDKWKKKTFTNKRKSECTDWLVKMKADILNGEHLETEKITLKDFMNHWLDFYVENNKSVNTLKYYKYPIYNKIFPSFISNIPISKITSMDITTHLNDRIKIGDSVYIVNTQLKIMNNCFNYAVRHNLIKKNLQKMLKQLKKREKYRLIKLIIIL